MSRQVEWQRKNAALHNARVRLFNINNPRKALLKSAKDRATKFGHEFNLSLEDVVIPDVCPVFGPKFERCSPYAASLDRIDPKLGYTKGNVQVMSKRANAMKSDATVEQLRQFANWIKLNV